MHVEVCELEVNEGTGKLLVVRIAGGRGILYGTSEGLFKRRIGKNCMPLDPQEWTKVLVRAGSIDWSGQVLPALSPSDLDSIEMARARNFLRRANPNSELLKQNDEALLIGLGAVRNNSVTHTGLLLFSSEQAMHNLCPQNQIHYVHQSSETEIDRNNFYRTGLLAVLEKIEEIFQGPANPEEDITLGLFKLRIPAFPIDVVREAVLNAITHRDYSDPNEILIRHTNRELVVTSPGGFMAGITPENILRHEPISRNRTLAEAFQKLGLVERAGVGRFRIFQTLLSYGKRTPKYETDGSRVILRIFNGYFDERMAKLVARWKQEGREIELDSLIVLDYLRENAFINTPRASQILQLPPDRTRQILDHLAQPRIGLVERRGVTRAATYHLTKAMARDLLGKAAYTRTRGLDKVRFPEMIKAYLRDHRSITPSECRELLGLGESQSARVEVSRYLRTWSGEFGFLIREGKGPSTRYFLSSSK